MFLHIGLPKTGTTAIQKFLFDHRRWLEQGGILYPRAGCAGNAHYALTDALGFKVRQYEPDRPALDVLKNEIEHELDASPAANLLFSSENFAVPGLVEVVSKFFDGYQAKVIVYLRRHDSWWESNYWQAVRMVANPPWGRGFEAYLAFHEATDPPAARHSHYRYLVDRWAEVLGKSNIVVRPYERAQIGDDIVKDLLRVVGLENLAEKPDARSEQVNESRSLFSLNLIDIYQRCRLGSSDRASLIRHALSLSRDDHDASVIPPGLRRRLVDQNMDDYRYIATEYLHRADGILFEDPLPAEDEPWFPPKPPTPMELVEETVKAINTRR